MHVPIAPLPDVLADFTVLHYVLSTLYFVVFACSAICFLRKEKPRAATMMLGITLIAGYLGLYMFLVIILNGILAYVPAYQKGFVKIMNLGTDIAPF
ncbi:hypothetical protein CO180_02910 [candidate division WWE3 bacterium CG_4_9_14_3_um_filter_41_6]|uniref:Uncharacterized protein n=1 Tax=candidate division WWE3 bacterium CG_4_10_14_0_2_um_filter_41_14 TaxID=1975072 RepID=A0A2M7TH16_UNCKA|nr:MAG: hypothetical protein COY32_05235 [candidate division WWE3 bacterium CG_4_10_14_0_2_um_filter_41_14]PJA38683.1 MAG: hypothetical protein CO180_02910 [candidate division WWE3 bacterium CG_4_9_14_3_um_filter_41_6]